MSSLNPSLLVKNFIQEFYPEFVGEGIQVTLEQKPSKKYAVISVTNQDLARNLQTHEHELIKRLNVDQIIVTVEKDLKKRPTQIAIASGKGGVGKSTTTLNLAYALLNKGFKVGIIDADIYGPSLPMLVGEVGHPVVTKNGRLVPIEKDGLYVMSMGFLIQTDTAVLWRGPMIQKALHQFFEQVDWPDLDFLLLDLPPGTGDTHISLIQKSHIEAAFIVTTPQDIARQDAKRGLNMFKKLEIPVLGLVENMSCFVCRHCGEKTDVFPQGKSVDLTELETLIKIPLHPEISTMGDQGQGRLLAQGPLGKVYKELAQVALAFQTRKHDIS